MQILSTSANASLLFAYRIEYPACLNPRKHPPAPQNSCCWFHIGWLERFVIWICLVSCSLENDNRV